MEETGNIYEGEEKRSEPRSITDQYCSVEFSISEEVSSYLFEIKDISSFGLCIIVKKGSAILNHLRVGDIMDIKYYRQEKPEKPERIKTEIKHITKDDLGRYEGNYLVGLSVVGKGNLSP